MAKQDMRDSASGAKKRAVAVEEKEDKVESVVVDGFIWCSTWDRSTTW